MTLLRADARHIPLRDGSVNCCVTSPPYWGLRDYGSAGQIGLERTPEEYVAAMVAVFREVRRVLRDDGTLWLNLGDCYATGAGAVGDCPGGGEQGARWRGDVDRARDDKRGYRGERLANGRGDQPADLRVKTRATRDGTNAGKHTAMAAMGPMTQPNRMPIAGLKPKDLVGVPWRVAFALQADGWFLRSDIIWSKPNPMPESVGDRPTKAHEYVFLLSKSERYFYDAAAIAEPATTTTVKKWTDGGSGYAAEMAKRDEPPATRNRRSVWSIAPENSSEAHFAVMPSALAALCVLAGSPGGGLILDPFIGSGTVGRVAEDCGRRWVGCDLSADYLAIATRRTAQMGLLTRAAAQ